MKLEFSVDNKFEVPDVESFLEDFAREFVDTVKMRTPTLTGTLQNSVSAEQTTDGFNFGTDVDYGTYVEFGTSKMPAHNMFRSTVEEADLIASRIQVKKKE